MLAALSLVVLLLWIGRPSVYASPPLLTDDPDTPGDGRWEINLPFTVEKLRSEMLLETPLLDINYGLGEWYFSVLFFLISLPVCSIQLSKSMVMLGSIAICSSSVYPRQRRGKE